MLQWSEAESRYAETIRELGDRLVEAQRPVRILDAVQWGDEIAADFLWHEGTRQPAVDADYYQSRPLGYDPASKRQDFLDLELEVKRRLGEYNPVGQILRRMCREYVTAIAMIEARGTPDFSRLSRDLYGSPQDVFHAGEPTLAEFGEMMAGALSEIDANGGLVAEPREMPAEQVVDHLRERLGKSMPELADSIRVLLSDGIVSDAAAGSDYIKIRSDARFNARDVRLLEVHEGWVHLGTTLNGKSQPICTFLSKGPPSSTVTQEGLAVLMENLSFSTHPERLRRVANRIRAVNLADSGANFLDVWQFYLAEGNTPEEAYQHASRVFRGSTPDGRPFTKDVSYSKGFVQVYNYIQLAVRRGKLDRLPLLFCGKTTIEDVHVLADLVAEGIVRPPTYLPPMFADLPALVAWMCYSSFLSRLRSESIEADFAAIL